MEVQCLRTFVDVAETVNFRMTSERLMMSQPSVAVHIRLLEESLGLSLFKRSHNRVSLTEEGRHFKDKAAQVLEQLDDSVEELHSFAQGYREKWILAISPLMAETILPYVLKLFIGQHPEVELVIRVEESEKIQALVESEQVTAGISVLPPLGRAIAQRVVYEDPLLFILPRDTCDDENGPVVSVGWALRNSILFTHHHPVFWEELLGKLRLHVPGIRTMKVMQAHIAKRFIQEGLGSLVFAKVDGSAGVG
ncbi:LysR family transcriptional regulator [Planococcus sp. ISL-110]|uniref:LysR family transcriptional regulator n=1 Tax=Planococcus sp. ISL-110 TaxID=2819167 RepID=UPI00203571A9|nr:LysR family transcriptional regulator [Planococcus sp. ISL-110]